MFLWPTCKQKKYALRAEEGADPGGVLRPVCPGAGAGVHKVQGAITAQPEKTRFNAFDAMIRALPEAHPQRATWTNLDRFSTTWVSCWPSKDAYLTNGEFGEAAARYLGLPSQACRGHVGASIGAPSANVDEFGDKVLPTCLETAGGNSMTPLSGESLKIAVKWVCRSEVRSTACLLHTFLRLAATSLTRLHRGSGKDWSPI